MNCCLFEADTRELPLGVKSDGMYIVVKPRFTRRSASNAQS